MVSKLVWQYCQNEVIISHSEKTTTPSYIFILHNLTTIFHLNLFIFHAAHLKERMHANFIPYFIHFMSQLPMTQLSFLFHARYLISKRNGLENLSLNSPKWDTWNEYHNVWIWNIFLAKRELGIRYDYKLSCCDWKLFGIQLCNLLVLKPEAIQS